ncbi:MAG: hypothetical protein ACI8T1_000963 [Verrucomicrobiales bacterium]|jgi:hypothetical protein
MVIDAIKGETLSEHRSALLSGEDRIIHQFRSLTRRRNISQLCSSGLHEFIHEEEPCETAIDDLNGRSLSRQVADIPIVPFKPIPIRAGHGSHRYTIHEEIHCRDAPLLATRTEIVRLIRACNQKPEPGFLNDKRRRI